MHDSRTIASVAWRDKKTVRLLSTHTRPVVVEGEERPTVPRRNGAVRKALPTSPVHLEYTTYMRGVDVADQLRTNYSCQVCTLSVGRNSLLARDRWHIYNSATTCTRL
jgi:hypothetical protein